MDTANTISTRNMATPVSAIDPVCGMTVQADKAAARLEWEGKLYLFCSTHCQHQFEADPQKYIGAAQAPAPAPAAARAPTASGHGMLQQDTLRRGAQGQAKEPVCGMLVDKASALRSERGGRSYYSRPAAPEARASSPASPASASTARMSP